ncbi:MAG: hypothetical protein Q9168_005307 [Polycauliona sp. 1 TL-2023]
MAQKSPPFTFNTGKDWRPSAEDTIAIYYSTMAETIRATGHQSSLESEDGKRTASLICLPPEILDTITELLSKVEKANLAATNNAFHTYLEPRIWRKIKSRIGTALDTEGLVDFLTSRPDIASMVRVIVADEYHPIHTRRLLSIELPEMWNITIQHEGEPVRYASEREKRALNRSLIKQPRLRTFVFWIELVNEAPYSLSKEDAALFRQPNVERFRLSYIDFSAFESLDEAYFTHTSFNRFDLESSGYTPKALDRFVSSASNMTELNIQHFVEPPFVPSYYLPILSRFSATLKVLRFMWRASRLHHTSGQNGLDLTAFSALRLLRIQPSMLLGPSGEGVESYANGSSMGITELVRSRIPPGLKILLLESLTIPPPFRTENLCMLLFPMDKELITCLIEQKENLVPKLTYIFMLYLEEMVEPQDLYDVADKHGMQLCGLYKRDIIDPRWEKLDEDGVLGHRELRGW